MQKSKKFGKSLSRKAMKEVKGGVAAGSFTLWNCGYSFLLCHDSNPVYDDCSGFSTYCINTRRACSIPYNQCI
jgi:hypothetical protein